MTRIFVVPSIVSREKEVPMKRLALLLPVVLACSSTPGRSDGGSSVVISLQGDSSVQGDSSLVVLPQTDGGSAAIGTVDPGTFLSVSAGNYYTCGVRTDNTIACWGTNTLSQSLPPAGTFNTVDVGSFYACGVQTDGSIVCWGDAVKLLPPPAGVFASVSVGDYYACGLKPDGAILCWQTSIPATPPPGRNTSDASAPFDTQPAGTFTSISGSASYFCGVQTDGTIACWGIVYAVQPTPAGTFTSVSGGDSYFCGVRTDGAIACWGTNRQGQSAPPAGTFASVSVGASSSCGVRTDGTIACWSSQFAPPAGIFTSVSVGASHACGVRTDGTIACWDVSVPYNGCCF
jgi:alpha-tubulin suppressor-like RCC1 family protein